MCPLNSLFESDDFLAVDKPAGWLTIPGRQGAEDGRTVLHAEVQKQRGEKLWVVHRLDVEVSGIVLFARNAAAHRDGSMWFESRTPHKFYEAWTTVPSPPPIANTSQSTVGFQWESRLARGKKRAYAADFGKECVTIARPIGTEDSPFGPIYRWELEPRTGRSHQLRYEMMAHGMPILGDGLYGCKSKFIDGVIALRAVKLDLTACRPNLPVILAKALKDYVADHVNGLIP